MAAIPEIANLEITAQNNNVLRYNINFDVSEAGKAFATYYYVELGDTVIAHTAVSDVVATEEITIIGLLPSTNYWGVLNVFNSSGINTSEVFEFATEPIPIAIPGIVAVDVIDESQLEGYVLTDGMGSISQNALKIHDRLGRIIWYEILQGGGVTCRSYNFTKDNTVLLGNCNAIKEKKLTGEVITNIDYSPFADDSVFLHHDLMKNDAGQYVMLVGRSQLVNQVEVGGPAEALVVGDGLLVLEQDGSVAWEWSTFDHLNPVNSWFYNTAFWSSYFGDGVQDWLHSNAINQDIDGNYLMSCANTNQIVKFDANTGEVIWQLGEGGDFNMLGNSSFDFQHAISALEPNVYMLFDNRGLGTSSRAIEIRIDTSAMTANLNWEFILPGLYSPIISSSYRLPNGNTLICSGNTRHLMEVNAEGEIVWQVEQDLNSYRAYYVPYLYEPLPNLTFELGNDLVCADANLIPLEASPAGGYFTGVGVVNGNFDPSIAGIGTHEITFNYGYKKNIQSITYVPATAPINKEGNMLSTTELPNEFSYQWLYNFEPILGANSASYLAEAEGPYQVIISHNNGCEASSDAILVLSDGLGNTSNIINKWQVAPNPLVGDAPLLVQYSLAQTTSVQIDLYSAKGKKTPCFSTPQQTIGQHSISIAINDFNLPKGIYFMVLQTANKRVCKKVVKL